MERRLTTKVQNYQLDFKNAIKDWVDEQKATISSGDTDKTSDFLKFVFDFTNLTLSKEDFRKRKRTKNQVPQYERCTARRANGEQCTRRKREGSCFCGTHIKGTPHGRIEISEKNEGGPNKKKIKVWTEEIMGITYFIDNFHNVYDPHEIMNNVENPNVIAKWEKNDQNNYIIPSLMC